MKLAISAYASIFLAHVATLYIGGWPHSIAAALLSGAAVALLGVGVVTAIPRDLRALWHRRQAEALEGQAARSDVWLLILVASIACALAAHAVPVGTVGS